MEETDCSCDGNCLIKQLRCHQRWQTMGNDWLKNKNKDRDRNCSSYNYILMQMKIANVSSIMTMRNSLFLCSKFYFCQNISMPFKLLVIGMKKKLSTIGQRSHTLDNKSHEVVLAKGDLHNCRWHKETLSGLAYIYGISTIWNTQDIYSYLDFKKNYFWNGNIFHKCENSLIQN